MLVDTDVLIWHLRGYAQATRHLDQLGSLKLSAVSYLEVLQGVRNKAELTTVSVRSSGAAPRAQGHGSGGAGPGCGGRDRCAGR